MPIKRGAIECIKGNWREHTQTRASPILD